MDLEIKRKNDKTFCCVYGRSSRACDDPSLSFHYFPKEAEKVILQSKIGITEELDRREAWINRLKMGKKASKHMRVCSLHFSTNDYYYSSEYYQSKRYLKKNVIPNCNLPKDNVTEENKVNDFNRNARRLKREENKNKTIDVQEENVKKITKKVKESLNVKSIIKEVENATVKHVKNNLNEVESAETLEVTEQNPQLQVLETNEQLQENGAENVVSNNEEKTNNKVDKEIQVKSGDLFEQRPFFSTISSDKDLSTLTGIASFKIFNGLIEAVKVAAPNIRMNSKICVEDKILMTYMKLRQNMSYSVLSVLFNCCTVKNCRNTVIKMIDILSSILQYAIIMPSKEETLKNIPNCFEDFYSVRGSIDCTEIPTQKPKNLCCQMCLYSHYKGGYTCKIMTVVSSSGHLVFRSKAYGGRASDKAIFEQSNFVKLLEKGDSIMTNKGFLIDDMCKKYDINLLRPAFLKEKKQFLKEEAVLDASISSARVHVERYNQRIKAYQILDSKLPTGLIGKIDQIFTVICGTINLSAPILKDNKFIKN